MINDNVPPKYVGHTNMTLVLKNYSKIANCVKKNLFFRKPDNDYFALFYFIINHIGHASLK